MPSENLFQQHPRAIAVAVGSVLFASLVGPLYYVYGHGLSPTEKQLLGGLDLPFIGSPAVDPVLFAALSPFLLQATLAAFLLWAYYRQKIVHIQRRRANLERESTENE